MTNKFKITAIILLLAAFAFSACGGKGAANGGPGSDGGIIISAADGGTINYNNNEINFVVPENSLISDTEIKIEPLSDIPAGGADGLVPYGQAYKFSPGGTEFDISTPAVMEMEYNEELLAQMGFSPDTLSLYYYDEQLETYVAVSTIIDKDSKKLIANIEHFTIYVPMARAKLATNNIPYVALQNSIPNPIRANAPIFIRATVTDYDGSISGAKLYYRKLQPSAGVWNEAVMFRETRLNVADTYGYIIPASFLTSSDLDTGNDIEYYVKATDNFGKTNSTAVRSLNVTRIYKPGTLTITPASLNISAGFERSFTVKGKDTGNTTFTLVPENISLSSASGILEQYYAGGVYYKAQTVTSSADKLSAGFGAEAKTADINVYAGEITSIGILDTNGQKINGSFTVTHGTNYEFDAAGYDDYGNTIPIIPVWSADSGIGTISTEGILSAYFTGPGKISITLGDLSDEQVFDYAAVSGVSLDLTISVKLGDTRQLTAAIAPVNATIRNLSWSSSDTSIAAVSANGLVTAVAKGTATITVITEEGGFIASSLVNVFLDTDHWAQSVSVSGTFKSSNFKSVGVDTAGNIYAAGNISDATYSFGNGVTATGGSYDNILLVKYNSAGVAQWAQTANYSEVTAAAVDADGNVYVAGYLKGTTVHNFGNGVTAAGSSSGNVLLVKYNSSGIAQWAQTNSTGTNSAGFFSVNVDTAGNVYAVGHTQGYETYTFSNGITAAGCTLSGNVLIVKYNSSGAAQWAQTVNSGSGSNLNSMFYSVSVDTAGNIYAAGWIQSNGTYNFGNSVTAAGISSDNILLVKYNSSGTAQWAQTVSSGSNNSILRSVTVDTAGNVYAAGYITGTVAFGFGNGVTAAGSYSSRNIILIKYNSSGTAQWAQTVSSGSNDSVFESVAADSSGNVYAAGSITGTGAFGFGNGVTAAGILLVKYNSSGAAQWAETVPSASISYYTPMFYSLSVDTTGNIYAAGKISNTGVYDFGGVTAAGGSYFDNVLLVKYNKYR